MPGPTDGYMLRTSHDDLCRDIQTTMHGRIDRLKGGAWRLGVTLSLLVLTSIGGTAWWARGVQAQADANKKAVQQSATAEEVAKNSEQIARAIEGINWIGGAIQKMADQMPEVDLPPRKIIPAEPE